MKYKRLFILLLLSLIATNCDNPDNYKLTSVNTNSDVLGAQINKKEFEGHDYLIFEFRNNHGYLCAVHDPNCKHRTCRQINSVLIESSMRRTNANQ